jgi:hypothetical protein
MKARIMLSSAALIAVSMTLKYMEPLASATVAKIRKNLKEKNGVAELSVDFAMANALRNALMDGPASDDAPKDVRIEARCLCESLFDLFHVDMVNKQNAWAA